MLVWFVYATKSQRAATQSQAATLSRYKVAQENRAIKSQCDIGLSQLTKYSNKTAQNKIDKYSKLASTHIFYPFAIETTGTWHEMAIELTQEIGKRISTITEDTRETTFFPTHFHRSAKYVD